MNKLVLLVFLFTLVLAGCTVGELQTAPIMGALAPDFELQNLAGETVHLSDYRGQSVLINFWATWCGPCVVEMPDIQERYDAYIPDLVVLGLNFDEPQETVQAFVNELELTFPILLDVGGKIQQQYQVRGYPSSFFVDPEGVIQVIHIGVMLPEQIDEYLFQIGIPAEN